MKGPAMHSADARKLYMFTQDQAFLGKLDNARMDVSPGNRDDRAASFCFGRFEVWPGARLLLRDGEPVELGSRAFDILVALLKSRGELVTKAELMSQVWPSTVVDEGNLRFQMTTLRKALGPDRDAIKTIPGRGYFFAAEISAARNLDRSEAAQVARATQPVQLDSHASDQALEMPAAVAISDDPQIREAIRHLLRLAGVQANVFASEMAFLAASRRASRRSQPQGGAAGLD
jgi:DNA-binding winged helix-turn-helix (wHTH) protein